MYFKIEGYSKAVQSFKSFSGIIDDVARQREDGAPQVRPKGYFSRLPTRRLKQQPALVTVNSEPAKVMSTGGSAPYTYEALVDLAEGSNTVTIEATDGNGNVASQSYSVTVGGVQMQLEYDLNGNLRYEKDATGTVLREFQWDSKNRLLKVTDGTQESEFAYDGQDRRVRLIETENSVEQSNNVYIWNGILIAQKRASNGATVGRSYFIQGFEEGVNNYFYTRDHLGSVREVIGNDGQTVEAVYDYSPWGEVSKIAGTGTESDFLYTGHFYHAPSDLHLALYRAYNPALGMWLSRDPLNQVTGELAEMLSEGPNLFAYVGNNPVNGVDPLGLWNLWNPLTYGLPSQPGENPWNPLDSSAEWGATAEGAGDGAAAYADGLIPYADPFKDTYDSCASSNKWSKAIGSTVRDGLLFYAGGASMTAIRASRVSTTAGQRFVAREFGPSWTSAIGGKTSPGSLAVDYAGKWASRTATIGNISDALDSGSN